MSRWPVIIASTALAAAGPAMFRTIPKSRIRTATVTVTETRLGSPEE